MDDVMDWNPMEEYLAAKAQKETQGTEQTQKKGDDATVGTSEAKQKSSSSKERTINPSDDEKVFGSATKTRDASNQPDPLRDNYTREKQRTYEAKSRTISREKTITVDSNPEKTENDNIERPTLETVATSFLGRIDRIENENQQLLDDNKRLLDSLRRMDNDSTHINDRLKYAEDKFQKSMTENHLLKGENADLTKQIHNLKSDNDSLRKAAYDADTLLKVQTKQFESEKEQLQHQLDEARKLIQSLQSQNETLTEVNRQLESKIASLENDNSASVTGFESQLMSLEDQVNQLQNANDQLKIDLEESERENEKLLKNLERERDKNDKLTQKQNEQDGSVSDLKMALQAKEELCETLEQETAGLSVELSNLQQQLKEMENKLIDLQGVIKARDEELTVLQQDKNLLQKKLDIAENQGCQKCNSYIKDIRRLERKAADYRECVDTLRLSGASVSELSKQKQEYIEELQKEVIDLRIQNTSLLADVSKFKGENVTKNVLDVQLEEIKASYKRVIEENRRLKSVNAQKNMEETNYKSEKEELQKKHDELQGKLDKAYSRIRKLEALIDEIYDNEEFQNYMNNDTGTEKSVSLPDIAISNTPRYSQHGRYSRTPRTVLDKGRTTNRTPRTVRSVRSPPVQMYSLGESSLVRKRKR